VTLHAPRADPGRGTQEVPVCGRLRGMRAVTRVRVAFRHMEKMVVLLKLCPCTAELPYLPLGP
jgi:hypothetical protein